jgi:hypothetical protein
MSNVCITDFLAVHERLVYKERRREHHAPVEILLSYRGAQMEEIREVEEKRGGPSCEESGRRKDLATLAALPDGVLAELAGVVRTCRDLEDLSKMEPALESGLRRIGRVLAETTVQGHAAASMEAAFSPSVQPNTKGVSK